MISPLSPLFCECLQRQKSLTAPHSGSAEPLQTLPREGFVRLRAIIGPLGPIPVSKSTWWSGVKTGRFPAPLRLGRGVTVWRVTDIRDYIDKAG